VRPCEASARPARGVPRESGGEVMANEVVCKGKGKEGYKQFVNFTSPLREIAYHMESHSVTCHPAEVTFPAFTPVEARTRLSDPEEMQG